MKVAYLIAASGNYAHLQRLVEALADANVHFFIHIDAKSPMPENLEGRADVTFIPRRTVWWGGFSQVEITLDMIRAALAGGYDYYAYISGGDYPVRPNSYLYGKLAEGGEFINAKRGFMSHKSEKRVKYYYFDRFDRRNRNAAWYFHAGLELMLRKVLVKRKYPFRRSDIWHGSSWWILSRRAVEYVLGYIEANPGYVKFYRTSLCPDESFFQTILANSDLSCSIKGNLTFTNWRMGESGPDFITDGHLPLIAPGARNGMSHDPFFARKFTDESSGVVDLIEELYRKPQ